MSTPLPDSLTEVDIKRVVTLFYASVRADPLLAPVFATRIADEDWPKHEAHICDFWSSVLLQTRRFEGRPMRKHLALENITPDHFSRWLALFEIATHKALPAGQAKALHTRAQQIAQSFQMGLCSYYQNQIRDNPFEPFGLKLPPA